MASPKRTRNKKKTSAAKKKGKPTNKSPTAKKRTNGSASRSGSAKSAVSPGANIKAETAAAFPIVGLGASAGGLEALESFLKAMPIDSGIAFVLVVHLDPTHVSILPELLQKRTKMPVRQIVDGMKVEPNQVFVIPPNQGLTILHGVLHLLESTQPRGANLPIDSFFRSLAQDQERNAGCIIFSGTGTDGTLGVKAIKGGVGMVMVQDPESAKYEGMPRSAIATGLVDYVLPPAMMPDQLIKYTQHATREAASNITSTEGPMSNALQKIFAILRARTEHDFSLYKKNTIRRRIERRMNMHQIHDISDYVRYLQESEREAGILFKELLIGVTSFFRDPAAFESLEQSALPKMLAEKQDDDAVRVWVPGCASGEEAYSAAILLHECIEQIERHIHVQVFGTDIDDEAINVARAGLYSESVVADVGPGRMKRHFVEEEDGRYRIKKSIRETLVFAPQNVIMDPPFTKLDLICCRNLLIYLGSELQRKLLPIFHYSLRPGGILFLGSSETIGQATDLFATVDRKWKIFRRKPMATSAHPTLAFPAVPSTFETTDREVPGTVQRAEEHSALQLIETILRQSDTPPCAIINDAGNVVYIHGRTGRFLEPAEGKASMNIIEMARPGIKRELSAAVRRVTARKEEVVHRDVKVPYNGETVNVDLIVKPILEQNSMYGLMMVVFEEKVAPTQKEGRKTKRSRVKRKDKTVKEFEQELQATRESLQTTIEELETSNEELKSTNEELQSTNEELQSTNEELETSKEELQSLNEESATVNAELQARIDELSRANDDMKNLLDSTEIATIFLDPDLCVRRFTPKATEIIPLTATDNGRPIQHLVSSLTDTDLAGCGKQVLEDLVTHEREVQSKDGQNYVMRIRPYRTVANLIDGVVITLENITRLKQMDHVRRLATVLQDSNDAITLLDSQGSFLAWNRGAERMYGYTEAEALRMNIRDLLPESGREEMSDLARRVFAGERIDPFDTQRLTKNGSVLNVWLTVTPLSGEEGQTMYLATTERDITPTGTTE